MCPSCFPTLARPDWVISTFLRTDNRTQAPGDATSAWRAARQLLTRKKARAVLRPTPSGVGAFLSAVVCHHIPASFATAELRMQSLSHWPLLIHCPSLVLTASVHPLPLSPPRRWRRCCGGCLLRPPGGNGAPDAVRSSPPWHHVVTAAIRLISPSSTLSPSPSTFRLAALAATGVCRPTPCPVSRRPGRGHGEGRRLDEWGWQSRGDVWHRTLALVHSILTHLYCC